MATISNSHIQIRLDERWPRIIDMTRLDTHASLAGCPVEQPFSIELNGALYCESQLRCTADAQTESAAYLLEVPALQLLLHFRFDLQGQEIHFTMPQVDESGSFQLETLYLPDHRLVCGLSQNGDAFLRLSSWRINYSVGWLSGGEGLDYGSERLGPVLDSIPEPGAQAAQHACVWNPGVCAAVRTSIWAAPLVTHLDAFQSPAKGRAGRFSIWADKYDYRLRGQRAEPLHVTIALLGDYDGNGRTDWCDAANWDGDQRMAGVDQYREVMLYKLFLDQKKLEQPNLTLADCLEVIRCLHQISGGIKQIVYLVGWQHEGHDTGFPNPQYVNPRLGGEEALHSLIEQARQYNCVVSVHANLDDTYEGVPGYDPRLVARGPDGQPVMWFFNSVVDQPCYATNHTLGLEIGAVQEWIDNLIKLTQATESIHLDAYRATSETYASDGAFISTESEYQRGMAEIYRLFNERGIDVTSEAPVYNLHRWTWILPDWRHHYLTVMTHGRMGGFYRITGGYHRNRDHIGDGLGCGFVWDEMERPNVQTAVARFYSDWMYDQILRRKRMTGYQVRDWFQSAQADYSEGTLVRTGSSRDDLYTEYEGIAIARGRDRLLPWRPDLIFAFSPSGGAQSWTLPADWEGKALQAVVMGLDGSETSLPFTQAGRTICFDAPVGQACKLILKE
jgi:hypothetical protein